MKKSFLMSVLLFFLVFISCAEQIDTRTYKIENGTSREVIMKFYIRSRLKKTYNTSGSGLLFTGEARNTTGRFLNASLAIDADSVVVVFDSKRIQKYYLKDRVLASPETTRNIMLDDAYEKTRDDLYTFVFTEKDYENAKDCNGNCE